MSTLPDSIRSKVVLPPVEDVVLAILRGRLPEVQCQAMIEDDQTFPMILVRRSPEVNGWGGDARFTDWAYVDIQCLAEGIDGDQDAALLSEAVRRSLRDAWLEQEVVTLDPDVVGVSQAWISLHEQRISPHRVPDWATATGPVQYADLPTGVTRYEATHAIEIRVRP